MPVDDIEILKGKTNPNLLLIAPHGYPDDDENTGTLVRFIQKILDCSAIINEVYIRPKLLKKKPKEYEKSSLKKRILDLNYRPQAEKLPYYIEQIQQSIKEPESTIVVWIHGIDDKNIKDESKELGLKERLHCLIGYGQPDHETCSDELKDIVLRVGTLRLKILISTPSLLLDFSKFKNTALFLSHETVLISNQESHFLVIVILYFWGTSILILFPSSLI